MAKLEEQRRSPRVVTENLAGTMAFSLVADILNVSRGGFAIRTKHQLRVGNKYRIHIGDEENTLEAQGVITRCRLKGTRKDPASGDVEPIYEAGVMLDPPLSDKANELLPVMARSASVRLGPRLHGRFLAQPDSEATLSSDLEFEVKKISLSGLLAESEGPPWDGDTVNLEIRLGDNEPFVTAARIVDTKAVEGGDDPRSQYGVEFVDPAEEALGRLESFVLEKLAADLGPAD